ncbi:hypothetical protein [Sulfitobacter sp. 20_GPM-1509m]|uniref:hypothetical protein n=1 Tax=Sulfitobacter sp. 20_GPM-1509m TaxID=1380367 RepID=UPI0004911601|nr:hypothetical protein [Sulfitobacter sp. 20_GPM-1509m]
MSAVEFVGQSAKDSDNGQAATSRLINLYREPVKLGDRTQYTLKSVLGQAAFADLDTVFLRAMTEVDGEVYAVAGGSLYKVSALGAVTTLGTVADSEETTIAGNTGNVTVCAGGNYYVWDGTTLSQPTTGAFDSFGSAEYIGNYTVLTELNGRRVQWSDLADPTTLPGVNFRTSEARTDNNIRSMAIGGNLWVFKQQSIEIWYITDAAGAGVFEPISGSVLDTGLKAFGLVTKFRDGAFMVGEDGIVYITAGGQVRPVSTTAVETAIAEETPKSCFYYEDEGHKICVIRFRDRPSWCFDISTGEWHERAEGAMHGPWTAVQTVKAYDKWLCGTDLGGIYHMTRNNADIADELHRRAVSRTVSNDQELFIIDKVEFIGRVGRADLGRDVSCWIRVSRDNGNIWGTAKARSMGNLGQYEKRVIYRGLGQFRQATVELNMSDPVDVPINATASVVIS